MAAAAKAAGPAQPLLLQGHEAQLQLQLLLAQSPLVALDMVSRKVSALAKAAEMSVWAMPSGPGVCEQVSSGVSVLALQVGSP
mmetsp:Transcript_93580/g.180469  ORF Transcript_93580/g.180469 Transcript_93580/m.180469 type:complete len:83 (-) Transcript_93580:967-1215(-)